MILAKGALFARHLRAVPFTAAQQARFWLTQPLLDAAYTVGLAQGLGRALRGAAGRPIG